MKWISGTNTLELTARNIAALTAKLDDPDSARMLRSGDGLTIVLAVETAAAKTISAAAAERVITLSRAELGQLAVEGQSIMVTDFTVTSVADEAHYRARPSGVVFSPSSGEVSEPDMTHWRFHHICEVCGLDQILTPASAFEAGWDYPPRMGAFGVISPRVCRSCLMTNSVWWAIAVEGYTTDMLSERQRQAVARILAEPESLAVTDE